MDIQKQRNIQLAMGILVMLCTGSIYAWSVFVPSLQEAFGWNASQTSLVFNFPILVGVAGVGLALSLLLKEHVDAPR